MMRSKSGGIGRNANRAFDPERTERARRRVVMGAAAGLVLLMGIDPSLMSPLTPWLAAGAEPAATEETRSGNLATAFARLEQPVPVEGVPIEGERPALPAPEMPTGPADLPSADEEIVPLGSNVAARAAGEPEPVVVDLGGMETTVSVTPDGDSPEEVLLRVADPSEAAAVGIDGLLLDVIDPSTATGVPAPDSTIDLTLSYADFGDVGGGDWASRLHFVRIPECPVDQAD